MNSIAWLDSFVQDVRYAFRGLRRSPLFTIVAVLTVAVGIGVNAAVFTVTNAVLFKGFAGVADNDRLLYIASRGPGAAPFVSYPDFADWRAQAESFDGIGAVNAVRISLSDQSGFAEALDATQVSANSFSLLGQRPLLGRDFVASDETPGAAPVVILSHAFWQRRYHQDPAVIGLAIRIDGAPATVIGVMALGFEFPRAQDVWLPLVPTPDLALRSARVLWFAFGRLTAGATLGTARAEMETIGRGLATAYPSSNQGVVPITQTFREFFVGASATTMYAALLAAVGCVLLIACANLANLLLARAIGRSHETSVRVALGAGRWRLVRQGLIESVMLSSIGGILGWWMASASVRIYELTAGAPGWFGHVFDYSLDARVVGYLIGISIGAGLLCGPIPALRLGTLDVNTALKGADRGASVGGRETRWSALLVVGEMALAVILLAGAGATIHSFFNIYRTELGVATENVLTAFVDLPRTTYRTAASQQSFYNHLQARLQALPGVHSVAIADRVPMQEGRRVDYEVAGEPLSEVHSRPRLSLLTIGPGYFHTLGVKVPSGREFDQFDEAAGAPVVVVNQRLVSILWPGQDALGKRLRWFDGATPGPWLTVVGVVPNIVQSDLTRQALEPLAYVPYRQKPSASMWLLAHTSVPAVTLASDLRREVKALDANLPLFGARLLEERVSDSYRGRQVFGGPLLAFAAVALLLAAIGLYAVIAHAVGQRTREIGIRTALGATTRDIVRLVLRQGLVPAAIGLTIGLALAVALMPLLQSQLVQVSSTDPVTLAASSITLLAAALLACVQPARRALRVDPVIALKSA